MMTAIQNIEKSLIDNVRAYNKVLLHEDKCVTTIVRLNGKVEATINCLELLGVTSERIIELKNIATNMPDDFEF